MQAHSHWLNRLVFFAVEPQWAYCINLGSIILRIISKAKRSVYTKQRFVVSNISYIFVWNALRSLSSVKSYYNRERGEDGQHAVFWPIFPFSRILILHRSRCSDIFFSLLRSYFKDNFQHKTGQFWSGIWVEHTIIYIVFKSQDHNNK